MAELETQHVFEGSRPLVFKAISRYEKYPEYLPGVTKIDVLPPQTEGSTCQVRYELHIIKKFYYVLNMFADEPSRVWWNLDESNIMKSNNGSWNFAEQGEKTAADYRLDIRFKGLVPQAVTDRVAKANLGAMMAGFQRLVDDTAAE